MASHAPAGTVEPTPTAQRATSTPGARDPRRPAPAGSTPGQRGPSRGQGPFGPPELGPAGGRPPKAGGQRTPRTSCQPASCGATSAAARHQALARQARRARVRARSRPRPPHAPGLPAQLRARARRHTVEPDPAPARDRADPSGAAGASAVRQSADLSVWTSTLTEGDSPSRSSSPRRRRGTLLRQGADPGRRLDRACSPVGVPRRAR